MSDGEDLAEKQIEALRDARNAPAVLKVKLLALRSTRPDLLVFVFEGIDDKRVYYHWIKRTAPDLKYEPLVCSGKGALLGLLQALRRDKSGQKQGTYFFVDKDFDDLRGLPRDDTVFITETYSIENQLVNHDVLDEVLKIELHCQGEIECRQKVIELFERQYSEFLAVTKEVNRRLFYARRLAIELLDALPNRVSLLANVELEEVKPSETKVADVVKLAREPEPVEVQDLATEFDGLDPRASYRGKFALLFLSKWVHLLVNDRNSESTKYFEALKGSEHKAKNSLTLDALAGWAALPAGLSSFLEAVAG